MTAWFVISAFAFTMGIILLLFSAFFFFSLLGQVFPLLDETRAKVQDLGDLAANTTGRAYEAMDIVENRVSQTMGQAALSGKAAANQALGVGTALAGLYMAVRLLGAVRGVFKQENSRHDKQPSKPRHGRKWWRKK